MEAPRLPAAFSLFRLRSTRGFHFPARYHDPEKEEREERLRRARPGHDPATLRREAFGMRMRSAWQRSRSGHGNIVRLLVLMALVLVIVWSILKGFGLLLGTHPHG